jgi:hypothetical protein
MRNPGLYYTNCYGVTYGPNYFVRPPFPPYQGVIPGPSMCNKHGCGAGGAGGAGAAQSLAPYANNPAAFQNAMQGYGQSAAGQSQGFGGFPRHLFARSPRDYFMYDTEPMQSPYNYGYAGYSTRYDCID